MDKKELKVGDWITLPFTKTTFQISNKKQLFKCREDMVEWRYAQPEEIDTQKILDALHYGMDIGYVKCAKEINQFFASKNIVTNSLDNKKDSNMPLWLVDFINANLR